MILFSTSATQHLAKNIHMQHGAYTIEQFSDGELFIRIDEDVQNKHVWVLAATQAPAEHLLELFFLLNALQRAGAKINLFITYFGYARQIIAASGEVLAAQVIANIFKNFQVNQIYILHPHSLLLQEFLPFEPVYDLDFFCNQAKEYSAIAAPDKGVANFARQVANKCNKDLILLSKTRTGHDEVEIESVKGPVQGQNVLLIDDMISTGHTITQAANMLKDNGAALVAAAATHGVFSGNARELLEESVLEKVTVTNSIAQHMDTDVLSQNYKSKINVVDISRFIQDIMRSAT